MGISDRDYIRRAPPPRGGYGRGGLSAMRTWSVNTWLIEICIGVFMIDGFTPKRYPQMGEPILLDELSDAPDTAVVEGPADLTTIPLVGPDGTTRLTQIYARPLVEHPGGQPIGYIRVQEMPTLRSWLHFSTRLGFLKIEFWRLIGFQFLHAHLPHLVFNMIALYFFGSMVERHLGSKRYLAFYLLCGIFGALLYVLLNLGGHFVSEASGTDVEIPGLLFNDTATPLIGASAGVFGVLMAGAYLAPRATVLLFFVLPMQLRTLAYALVALAFMSVLFGRSNAGGEAGHLGGAIAGAYFIRHPHHLHGFFDILGRFDPTSHHYRKKGRRVGGPARAGDRDRVDRILEKINVSGLQSLSEKEKRILREASER